MKILVCISGASFVKIGFKLLENIPKNHEIYAIVSQNAKIVLEKENHIKFDEILPKFTYVKFLQNTDISECVASGSFGVEATFITPCSTNTLAKIANGIADSLITRAASVAIKEQKRLILGVREMPFSFISLKQMSELSAHNIIIAPPVIGTYAGSSLEEIENFIVGKWLDLANIENNLYKRWQNE